MKRFGFYLAIFLAVLIIGSLCWLYFADYLEREKPAITLNQEIIAIGKQKNIGITFSDRKSGLSNLKVEIVQDNKNQILADNDIPSRGTKEKVLQLTIDTATLKLHDGPAMITITAKDFALIKNQTTLSIAVKIDTVPPQISILNPANYINQGGTGFIAYRISKPASVNGIYVNDYFTPGYALMIDNKPTYVAYFAVPLDASKAKTSFTIFAQDDAGNEAKAALPCVIREKTFRVDKMSLNENFLQQKMPEFQTAVPALKEKTLPEVFIYVNSQMRNDNFQTIQTICQKSVSPRLWRGAFLRMRNASTMSLFGDKRYYMAGGKVVAESLHMGVDLASHANAAIEAANNGIVVFTGALGIYGNTVIIDHGLGVFSLYGHLSSIETAVGKNVKREELIGHSGLSGLAGGDHLHFSIIVGGQFVNPLEWWDPHWIEDNINRKMRF
jgi:murein DD-endopeptidase MepM/ murein hydrolase activator NlpD